VVFAALMCAMQGEEDARPIFAARALQLDRSRILVVPGWVLRGIAKVETRSEYTATGIHYMDQRRGPGGEVGVFQMKRVAFRQVGLLSHRAEAARDPVCAEFCAIVYLRWCYRQTGSWARAVEIYHAGPTGDPEDGAAYLRDVTAAGRRPF
jgi:hypothetical protein